MSSGLTKTDQGMAISGKLVFSSVADLLNQGNQYLEQKRNSNKNAVFEIDCQAMQRIDSAGIALLIEWHRQCVEAKMTCRFVKLSDQAQSLIQAYRLQSLIAA